MASNGQRAAVLKRAREINKVRADEERAEEDRRRAAERENEEDRRYSMSPEERDAQRAAARRVVDEAPPLSPEKRARIRAIFQRHRAPQIEAEKQQRQRDLEQAEAEIIAERRAMPVADRLSSYAKKGTDQ